MNRRTPALAGILAVLLLPASLGSSSASPAPAADWRIDDPAGDVYLHDKTTMVPVPSTPANAHMDLRGVTIGGETEAGFYVTFALGEIRDGGGLWLDLNGNDRLQLEFDLVGSPVHYAVGVDTFSPLDSTNAGSYGTYFFGAWLCVRLPGGNCYLERLTRDVDERSNTVQIYVSKSALVGAGQPGFTFNCGFLGCSGFDNERRAPPGTPEKILPGDRLTRFQASYGAIERETSLGWYDEAPNDGQAPDYAFRERMANLVVAAGVYDGARENIEAGEATPFEIPIVNKAPNKRIINLSYSLEGAPENVSKIALKGPPSVSVPGATSRNITLVATAAPGTSSVRDVYLVIRGQSLGAPDELLYARLLLAPTISLSPTHPDVYFHTGQLGITGGPVDPALCAVFGCGYAWMNAEKDDPDDVGAEVNAWTSSEGLPDIHRELQIWSSSPSVRPLAFADDGTVALNLKLKADVPTETDLRVGLVAANSGTLIAQGAQHVSITPAGTMAAILIPVSAAGINLGPEDSWLRLRLVFQPGAGSVGAANLPVAGLRLVAKESGLRLPLVTPPEELDQGTPGAPMRLTTLGEKSDYVNPGESRLFNVTLLNVGTEPDVAHLSATVDRPGWMVRVLPGLDYRLASGESVVVGVLTTAPAGAKEGETATVRVNATSDGAPLDRGFLRLGLLATSGLDLRDDSAAFHADDDAQEKLIQAPTKKSTPGPDVLLILASVGLLALLRRRKT